MVKWDKAKKCRLYLKKIQSYIHNMKWDAKEKVNSVAIHYCFKPLCTSTTKECMLKNIVVP